MGYQKNEKSVVQSIKNKNKKYTFAQNLRLSFLNWLNIFFFAFE
jgi:hypothetical protein